MRMHWKCVPQNCALLNARVVQRLPDYRGRSFFVRTFLDGKSVSHERNARNRPAQKKTFTSKRDPAVSAPAMTRRFSAKNKLRITVEMSREPGQLCLWTIGWLAVVAAVTIWVEQLRRECGLQRIGQAFGQFGIGHRCSVWLFFLDYRELSIKYIAPIDLSGLTSRTELTRSLPF